MTDMKTEFEKWYDVLFPEMLEKKELARAAFYAAYELGMNKGFEMGKQVGLAVGTMEQKIKQSWECPLGNEDCKDNCGNYGCGN